MVGRRRLDNLEHCVVEALRCGIPGDFIEAGVWRGGAAIFIRGILAARGVRDRLVVVADSFDGVPPPQLHLYPKDAAFDLHLDRSLAVSVDDVKANFSRFGLLDDQVHFVKGWFRDTLPTLALQRWAVMRLDGDLYESTMDGLNNLYPGLSPGGFVIIDDYGAYAACAAAVDEYRRGHAISEPLNRIDWTGVYWQKQA